MGERTCYCIPQHDCQPCHRKRPANHLLPQVSPGRVCAKCANDENFYGICRRKGSALVLQRQLKLL